MLPELAAALGLTAGLYYHGPSFLAVAAGVSHDRWGARRTLPVGAALLAVGVVLAGVGASSPDAAGRSLQGAGAASAFTGAAHLAVHGFARHRRASAIGFALACVMLGTAAGPSLVAPLARLGAGWEGAWVGVGLFTLAAVTPDRAEPPPDPAPGGAGPLKAVLADSQAHLCGLCAGLLFLPTAVGGTIRGAAFVHEGWHADVAQAANRAPTLPLGWAVGAPLLGWLSDATGRRKPVFMAGLALALACLLAFLYAEPGAFPPGVLGFLLGVGSGAAVIPYAVATEANPDRASGSAVGVTAFIVSAASALAAPAYGWLVGWLSGGGLSRFDALHISGAAGTASVVRAMVLALLLRETGAGPRGRRLRRGMTAGQGTPLPRGRDRRRERERATDGGAPRVFWSGSS